LTLLAIAAECLGKSCEMPMSAESGSGSDMIREAVLTPRSVEQNTNASLASRF
jgi:hypothetical protein